MKIPDPARRSLANFGLLLLRLGAALPMLFLHGLPKFENRAEMAPNFGQIITWISPEFNFWLAVFAELVCAALVALGLLTRLATIPLIITMAVAFFIVHGGKLVGEGNGEMALIYAIPFLTLLFTGPGAISIDNFLFSRKGKSKSD